MAFGRTKMRPLPAGFIAGPIIIVCLVNSFLDYSTLIGIKAVAQQRHWRRISYFVEQRNATTPRQILGRVEIGENAVVAGLDLDHAICEFAEQMPGA